MLHSGDRRSAPPGELCSASMNDSSPPVPQRLADFEVIRRLGVGGMAEVFLAKKRGAEGTYKLLVVKRILPQHGESRRFRSMFAEEAMLATRLNHPNIVQVYEFQDYGKDGQLLSMEYVEGPDLRKVIRAARTKRKRLPPYVAAYIAGEVAKGLHYAHERRDERGNPMAIVHRDVSPQNILLSFEGAVKIADFGIASANLFREEPGVLKGKTAYMSPEQALGERADRRTDIYSLGVVFHELLTGRPLHGAAEGAELLDAVRAGQVEPPSTFAREIPRELEAVVMKALARRVEERYQTARDFSGAIIQTLFQAQQPIDSHVLETVLSQITSREHTSPGFVAPQDALAPGDEGSRSASRHATGSVATGGTQSSGSENGLLERGARRSRRPRQRQEVRHVAIVALQLHGLEQLAEAVGAAAAARFIEQLRNILGEIAFKRGARMTWAQEHALWGEHLLPSGGATAVVGLMANPSRAAADAARLAVDIHEAIHGACDDMSIELQASIGIVRGMATGKRDPAGHLVSHSIKEPALHLAKMLGTQAPAGRSWVAGGLYRLVRQDFVWSDAPTIALESGADRQLPENMRIYALVRPLTRQEKQQDPDRSSGDMVGRDAELAELHAAFHHAINRVRGSQERVVARVVAGEIGIGKSALVNTFTQELPDGTSVCRAEGAPSRSEVPYSLLADWLRALTGITPELARSEAHVRLEGLLGGFDIGEDRTEIMERLADLVAGQLALAADEGDAARNRQILTAGLRAFLTRQALDGPVVLIAENMQWSDRSSLEVIQELSRWNEAWPVLVVLVVRSGESVASFVGDLVRIELKGLSLENQIRLLQIRLGATSGVESVCTDLSPRIGGNPFFLLELADALLERGALELRERSDQAVELVRTEVYEEQSGLLPSTLQQLVADRLDELPGQEQLVVEWLAIAGGPVKLGDLSGLLGQQTDEAVMRLCARGLCDLRRDAVDVRHPVTRDVAYAALDRATRSDMHRRLGEHLSQTSFAKGLTAAVVARHFEVGHDRTQAANHYLTAAHTAYNSYQLRLAKRYFRKATKLLDDDDPRLFDASEALETICRTQGAWRQRRVHLTTIRRLAKRSRKPTWVAVALMRTSRMDVDAGRLARGLTSAQRAEEVTISANLTAEQVQAQALVSEILRDLGDMQGALAAVDRALTTAKQGEVPARQRAEVLRAKGTLLRRVGRVQEALDAQAEAIAIFRRAGARRMEAQAKNSLAFVLFVLGRYEDAIALGLDAIRIDLAIGGRLQIAKTLSNIGQSYAALGDAERGLAYLRRARVAHDRYLDKESKADTLLVTAELLLELGRSPEVPALLSEVAAINSLTGSTYDGVHEKIVHALLARASKDASAAVMYAFDARQIAESQAYVAFHFYAMSIEAAARIDIGEQHAGILLATTALGALETIQGSEYGLATRRLCSEVLKRASSPQAEPMTRRVASWVHQLRDSIRDPDLRARFVQREPVLSLIADETPSRVVDTKCDDDSEATSSTGSRSAVADSTQSGSERSSENPRR